MKKLIALVALLVTASVFAVNYPTPGASVPAGFVDDFKTAMEDARETGRFVFACFSGSDWCGWCVRLEKEVFSAGDEGSFAAALKDDYVFVFIDLPSKRDILLSPLAKEQNDKLVKEYKIQGFPTALIIDPNTGKIVEKTGYRSGGKDKYVEHLKYVRANADKLEAISTNRETVLMPLHRKMIEAFQNHHDKRDILIPELTAIAAEMRAAEVMDELKGERDSMATRLEGYLEKQKNAQ